MDTWNLLYEKAKYLYKPQHISPFIYSNHVVCALEAENGEIYTGVCIRSCSGVANLCAERVAALNMFVNSGQVRIKKILTFREKLPNNDLCVPCDACREFLMQLSIDNENTEVLMNYDTREIMTIGELTPRWWGKEKLKEEGVL